MIRPVPVLRSLLLTACALLCPVTSMAASSTATMTWQKPKVLWIGTDNANDHRVGKGLFSANLIQAAPGLPKECWEKTALGSKYLVAPNGPYWCRGNKTGLVIGTDQFRLLSCAGDGCQAIETFVPNQFFAAGKESLGYWSGQAVTWPKVVELQIER
ncbi:hypothetical protein MQE22_08615 [Acidithiobacillus sp. YTS05]|nr:hypothetical protein MQE22_08615 [Acidithiobacillus sp. YTS05]